MSGTYFIQRCKILLLILLYREVADDDVDGDDEDFEASESSSYGSSV